MFGLLRFKIRRMTKKLKSMQQARLHNQASIESLKKEIETYHCLAQLYKGLIGKKKYPFAREMSLEVYRASAVLEDAPGRYILGKSLLDQANFRRDLQLNQVFASPSNEQYMNKLYEEAHAYLLSAEQLNHVEAKRLRGLCYINGWGVPDDKKQGFDLVVASIEQENSWDRVPQIFASMGLNKPEFFSALTQMRQEKN